MLHWSEIISRPFLKENYTYRKDYTIKTSSTLDSVIVSFKEGDLEIFFNPLTKNQKEELNTYYSGNIIELSIREQGYINKIPYFLISENCFHIYKENLSSEIKKLVPDAINAMYSYVDNELFIKLIGVPEILIKRFIVNRKEYTTENQIEESKFTLLSKMFSYNKSNQHLLNNIPDKTLKKYMNIFYNSPWIWKKNFGKSFWDYQLPFEKSVIRMIRNSHSDKMIIPEIKWDGEVGWIPMSDYNHLLDQYNGEVVVKYDNKTLSVNEVGKALSKKLLTPIINKSIKSLNSTLNSIQRVFNHKDLPKNEIKREKTLNKLRKWMYCLYPWTHPLNIPIKSLPGEGYILSISTSKIWRISMIIYILKLNYQIISFDNKNTTLKIFNAELKDLLGFGLTTDEPYRLLMWVDQTEYKEFNENDILHYDWRIALGDEIMSVSEFKKLVEENTWMSHNENVKKIIEKTKRPPEKSCSRYELIKAMITKGKLYIGDKLRLSLENVIRYRNSEIPKDLNATLRKHQIKGFNWLKNLLLNGFSGILADEMGLGKTIQAITVMLSLKSKNPCLVICPSSLLGNWESEIKKFAPSLSIQQWHGSEQDIDMNKNVILTTYGTCSSRISKLENINFNLLCLDEAHKIKNSKTKARIAIAMIKSKYRIAITGTPIENSIEDLWSLFDILLPGYFESRSKFNKRFNQNLKLLQRLTNPFILRRTKKMIGGVGDKIIKNVYTKLYPKQAALYQKEMDNLLNNIDKSTGIQRKGTVLGLITKLKQICNHPVCYDKNLNNCKSGKLDDFKELIKNTGKTIVFTQYVKTAELLCETVKDIFGDDSYCYLYGGMTPQKRSKEVDKFQNLESKKVFIISIRAGGMGLNLTKARSVIMYDLWWNPAVEDQAIDRAHRIGQKYTVNVYRLLVKGTFEERIDQIIQTKRVVSESCIANKTKWITEMSKEELKNIFEITKE